jgi:hypothetical protein
MIFVDIASHCCISGYKPLYNLKQLKCRICPITICTWKIFRDTDTVLISYTYLFIQPGTQHKTFLSRILKAIKSNHTNMYSWWNFELSYALCKHITFLVLSSYWWWQGSQKALMDEEIYGDVPSDQLSCIIVTSCHCEEENKIDLF